MYLLASYYMDSLTSTFIGIQLTTTKILLSVFMNTKENKNHLMSFLFNWRDETNFMLEIYMESQRKGG